MKTFKQLLTLILLMGGIAHAQTNVSGTINSNTTWSAVNSPYVVTSSVTVESGIILTIETGVEVQFNSSTELSVEGTLTADGTIFTSAQSTQNPGDWQGLELSSISGSAITLTDCQILYATSGLRAQGGSADLTNVSILNSSQYGIYSYTSVFDGDIAIDADNLTISGTGTGGYNAIHAIQTSLTLANSDISTNGYYAVYLGEQTREATETVTSVSSITNTTLSSGTEAGLGVNRARSVTLGGNTFSSNDYPIIYEGPSNITYSSANTYTANDFDLIYYYANDFLGTITLEDPGLPYYFNSTKTIQESAELTIGSNVAIKFYPNTRLEVEGKLTADAAVDEEIIFTSYYDDNVGGDSNNDSNDTSPSNGKWYGINFHPSSDATSSIDGAVISWVNYYGAITTNAASPSVTNCEINNAYYGAQFVGASSPTFTNNTIGGSEQTPIAMSFEANPTFSNNVFSTQDNEYDAIGLLGGTMTDDANIIQRDFTDIENVTYVLLNHVEVPSGFTLTIDAGVVIKVLSGYEIEVHGTLDINGLDGEPVVFTSVNDDNFGNPLDTRNDGTDAIPAVGHVGGIYFSETSDVTSSIDFALLKFAEYGDNYQSISIDGFPSTYRYYDYDAAIAINSASPSITNTVIEDCKFGVDIRGASSPTISNNEIKNSEFAPFRLAIQSTPIFSGNIFTSVGWQALAILPETINYSATLDKRDVGGFTNITYVIEDMRINIGAQVEIAQGLFLKFPRYQYIEVYGGLKVSGTVDEHVLMTTIADDNSGAAADNDTEGNGNDTEPDNEEWGGIWFYSSSDDTYSDISYTDFLYSGYSYGTVNWDNAAASLNDVTISFSQYYGLYLRGASEPAIDQVSISTSGYDPIAMSYFANPTFTNITFDANGSNGIYLIDANLNANATLNKRDIAGINNIAYVMGNLTIGNGATLTIMPGVVVKKSNNTEITVNEGAINAAGTLAEPIIFTALADDSRGGDTNIDGNETVPAPGNWDGIELRESTIQTVLQYVEIRYAGNAGSVQYQASLISTDNDLLMENSLIQLSSNSAVGIYGSSTATLNNNRLENIAQYPVRMSMFSNPTFSGNTLENVGYIGLAFVQESVNQTATLPFRSFAGYDNIAYIPVPHYGQGVLTINSGTTLTVPAGMVFKHDHSTAIFDVEGQLHIAGTVDNPVVFTAIDDDTEGNPLDTRSDGPDESISRYGTVALFKNISNDNSIVEHVRAKYFDDAFRLSSAAPTIDNVEIINSNWGIEMTGLSEPNITNNTFTDLTHAPFSTSLVSYPASLSGNTIEGTTWKGIMINNETLTQDITLGKRAFAGIDNIPYIFQNYTVGLGVKLTIEPGVILKFWEQVSYPYTGGYLEVQGALAADGDAATDQTIVFTGLFDDFYGGDTNSDGSATTIANRRWHGIEFTNESSDSESILDHAIIKGSTDDGVTLESASPTITNCSFRNNGSGTSDGGIDMSGASNPTLSGNDFYDNGFGIRNNGTFTVNATGTWWGSNSGPYHETDNVDGQGDQVIGNVTFDPWATDNSLRPITGDISLNGAVSAYDAALGLQAVATLITLEARQETAADVSGDATISAMDASYILQYSAGLINYFPAEAENRRTRFQFASTKSDAIVSLGSEEIWTEDEVVHIPIEIQNIGDLYALEVVMQMGTDLELVEVTPEMKGVSLVSNYNELTGELRLAYSGVNPLITDGVFANLSIKLKANAVSQSIAHLTMDKVVANETDVTSLSSDGIISFGSNILTVNLEATAFSVYPNPVIDQLTVNTGEFKGQKIDLTVMDALGRVHLLGSFDQVAESIAFDNIGLEAGLYVLSISNGHEVLNSRFVVSK